MKKTKFAIIGAAGYIARKHVESIHEIGGDLVVAMDLVDNVGYLDKYFPRCAFYSDSSNFADIIDAMGVEYIAVCTPSYIHSWGTIAMLAVNKNVICEKPLCLDPEELRLIEKAEKDSTGEVNTILQLNFHPIAFEFMERNRRKKNLSVKIEYYSPRGNWYHQSWKGNLMYSGGLITNIGIHILQLLIKTFGEAKDFTLYPSTITSFRADLKFKNNNNVNLHLNIHRDIHSKRLITVIDKENQNYTCTFNLGSKLDQSLHL